MKLNIFNKRKSKTKMLDILGLAGRMFKTRRLRTLLTILGISIGIGAILFLVSLGYGLQNILLDQLATSDSLLSLGVTETQTGMVQLDENVIARISKIPEVKEVSPLASMNAQASIQDFTTNTKINLVHPSYFRLSGLKAKIGDLFTSEDAKEVVVSQAIVRLFDFDDPSQIIGQEVTFDLFVPKQSAKEAGGIDIIKTGEKFRIVGVIEEQDVSFVFLPFDSLGNVAARDYSDLKVKVTSDRYLEDIRSQIVSMGFLVSALSDTIEEANKIFKAIQIILALFGIVALVVSAIGMFNTMTIALLERTEEIGIMKSLGATNQDVWELFLAESIIMGFLGGLGGLTIGYLGAEIFNRGIGFLAHTLGGQSLRLFYQPAWFVITIIIFSSLIGVFTGLYPAKRAAKLSALDALRYK
jgi:putative ABC transport system permease protein